MGACRGSGGNASEQAGGALERKAERETKELIRKINGGEYTDGEDVVSFDGKPVDTPLTAAQRKQAAQAEAEMTRLMRELRAQQERTKQLKLAMWSMPDRSKAQKAAKAEAEAEYSREYKTEVQIAAQAMRLTNMAKAAGLIIARREVSEQLTGPAKGAKNVDWVTYWKHNGKKV